MLLRPNFWPYCKLLSLVTLYTPLSESDPLFGHRHRHRPGPRCYCLICSLFSTSWWDRRSARGFPCATLSSQPSPSHPPLPSLRPLHPLCQVPHLFPQGGLEGLPIPEARPLPAFFPPSRSSLCLWAVQASGGAGLSSVIYDEQRQANQKRD